MGILSGLEPRNVFGFFEEVSLIPRGSGNTDKISEYLISFAKSRNLECYRDGANNVIIIKEAAAGYEEADTLMIQSHTDMVCEKSPECTKDMSADAVDLIAEGDLISADGTTLGADDGIGMAYALAVLDDAALCHPRIEAVFTSDEEIGLIGAFKIDVSGLKAKKMLNLDSGDETTFTVSCAGGITSKTNIPLNRESFDGKSLKITVSGLSGGHSGTMIGEGGANSNVLMARLLSMLASGADIRLSHIEGGIKDNAITAHTWAVITTNDADKCTDIISAAEAIFKNEYSVTDPGLNIRFSECEYIVPMDADTTKNVLSYIGVTPNGVQKMSSHIEGLVETSLNFAIINCSENELITISSIRSSLESQKSMMADRLANLARLSGGTNEVYSDYPGWEFKPNSEFRNLIAEVYRDIFGTEPKTQAIHAGLECGLFSGMMPELDCVSYGPDMWDIHTPGERLSISSTKRVWEFIVELLKRMK